MSALERLARRAGIEPHYHDIWGRRRSLSEGTMRAFLAAMEIAATTEAEISASLVALEAAPWQRSLDPVVVLIEDARPQRVDVRLEIGRAHV